MQRRRYIRFFISSTFADMNLERDLLQRVIKDLSAKYAVKGWQIECVDLRWGITSEASFDNRTMRLCFNELDYCQKLSPKVNFIILSGQRYGWIPLPETLTQGQVRQILEYSNDNYRQIFEDWYKLDFNQLPDPVYVLQPRYGKYIDDTIWDHEVYQPLLSGLGNLESATELEIKHGTFFIDDANDHAIAYIRNLIHVPELESSTYIDDNIARVQNLHNKIRKILEKNNIYEERISFADYQSEAFAMRFEQEMNRRLSNIIDHTISDYHELENESDAHRLLAIEKNRLFIGRDDTLALVDDYIHNPSVSYALWFRDKSGIGKSALIAEIYRRYAFSHNVICRFCGETNQSWNGASLLNSIWIEMRDLYPFKWMFQDLPGFGRNDFSMSISEMFCTRFHQINGDRPLLILIDGINQLVDEESDEFFELQWLGHKLNPSIRIILTSTEDNRINTVANVNICTLDAMPEVDAMNIVSNLLSLHGRTLSESQFAYIQQCINQSERIPIYLTLLGHFLCDFASYDTLPILPTDFVELMRLVFNKAIDTHYHDPEFIRHALSLIVSDRQGLSQEEILRALSLDNNFMNYLHKSSYHKISNNSVPPIFWSRLYNDLFYFFKIRHSKSGELIYIYHELLSQAIREIYMKGSMIPSENCCCNAYRILSELYQDNPTNHAIMESVYCNYMTYISLHDLYHIESQYGLWAINRINDLRFLHDKLCLNRNDLMHDLLLILEIVKINKAMPIESVLNLKKDISGIWPCSWNAFLMQCGNLHPNSYLRSLVKVEELPIPLLKDELAGSIPYDLIAYVSGDSGVSPIISNDGCRVLSLYHNRHKIKVEDMKDLSFSISYALQDPVLLIDVTMDMVQHAIITCKGLFIYDYINQRVIEANASISNVTWVSLSDDGCRVAYGNRTQSWIKDVGIYHWGGEIRKNQPFRPLSLDYFR